MGAFDFLSGPWRPPGLPEDLTDHHANPNAPVWLNEQLGATAPRPAPVHQDPTGHYPGGAAPPTNPYQDELDRQNAQQQTDAAAAASQQKQAQTSYSDYAAKMRTASYPTFPNTGGFGTQSGYGDTQAAAQAAPTPMGNGGGVSHGANPWSFSGEALSR